MNGGYRYWVYNLVSCNKKPIGSEQFFICMIEAFCTTIDRLSEGRTRKIESQTLAKIDCVKYNFPSILIT